MNLKYIKAISGASTYTGGVFNNNHYVSLYDYLNVYIPTATGLITEYNENVLGTLTNYNGLDYSNNNFIFTGGYYPQIYQNGIDGWKNTTMNSPHDFIGYNGVYYDSFNACVYYVVSKLVDSYYYMGVAKYSFEYSHSQYDYYYYSLILQNSDISNISSISTPANELVSNKIIKVGNYFITGLSDVGLASFTGNSSNIGIVSIVSGGTNNYIQSPVHYLASDNNHYIYFTARGTNAVGQLQKCIFNTTNGTFSTPTQVDSGSTGGGITIKENKLYFGCQKKIKKYSINPLNGNLTHDITYDIPYFSANVLIGDINIDPNSDRMFIETSEGRIYAIEEFDSINGGKNRVIVIM